MIRRKHLPILLSALLCMGGCNLGTSPGGGGGGTEGEGLSGVLQDPDGRVVAGALVRVFPEPQASLGKSALSAEAIFDSVYSDSRGRFKFDSLPDGNYGLRSYVKRGDTTLVLMLRQIPYDGKEKSLGTHTLVVGGKLRMQVRSGTQPNDGQQPPPLPGVHCSVVGLPYVSLADSTGFCVLDGLPPGQYAVRLSYPGYADVVTIPIEVRPGQSSGEGPWDMGSTGPARRYPSGASTLAHWTFDARDSLTGEFPDAGPYQIGLQGYGAVPLNASPFGKAASFNGSSYLATANLERNLTGKNTRYLTLQARVRLPQYPSGSNRDSSGAVMGAPRGIILLVRADGGLAVLSGLDTNATWTLGAAWSRPGVVPLNQWVDLAVSVDRQTRQAYGYVNGAPVQLFNHNGSLPEGPEPQLPFYVGGYPGANRAFIGEIDEARVSDTLVFGEGLALIPPNTVAPASTVGIAAAADVTVSYSVPGQADVQGYGRRNRGKEAAFGPGTYSMVATSRALARFPVPAQYASRIASAKIRFTPTGWTAKNTKRPFRIDLHRVLKSWKEGQGRDSANSAVIDGATGLERFWGTQNGAEDWTQPLLGLNDVDALASPAATLTKTPGSMEAWEFDVTSLARAWAADTTQNFGVLMATEIPASDGETWDYPTFHAREASGPDSLKPTLILSVTP